MEKIKLSGNGDDDEVDDVIFLLHLFVACICMIVTHILLFSLEFVWQRIFTFP